MLTLSTDFVGYDSSLDSIIVSRYGSNKQLYVDRNVISASIEALDANNPPYDQLVGFKQCADVFYEPRPENIL